MSKRNKKQKIDPLVKYMGLPLLVITIIIFSGLYYVQSENKAQSETLAKENVVYHKKGLGRVKIIEYADIQCPSCAYYNKFLSQYLKTKNNLIEIEYRHFPLTSIHRHAKRMSEYSIAVSLVNKNEFWNFINVAYIQQKAWTNLSQSEIDSYINDNILTKINIDKNLVITTLEKEKRKIDAKLAYDYKETVKAKLQGTPSFVVNGKLIKTPDPSKEAWDKLIKSELKKK